MLSKEELLKPRIKVIADYPGSSFEIGEVLRLSTSFTGNYFLSGKSNGVIEERIANVYPHLFKPLQWWEERAESDLTDYVKLSDGTFYKVQEWHLDLASKCTILGDEFIHGQCPLYEDFFPATESEYTAYQLSQKVK